MVHPALSLYTCAVLDFELEPLLRALAAEFARRDMQDHLRLLRVFYARYRAETKRSALSPKPSWEIDTVLEWLAVFRLPPLEHVYQELDHGAPCPRCATTGDPMTAVFTRAAVRGTTVLQCLGCGERWVVRTQMPEEER